MHYIMILGDKNMIELYKKYIDVDVFMSKEKQMRPVAIYIPVMGVNKRYLVDKILDIRRSSSAVGGCGIRYRCKIRGQERNLFFEKNRWFIESHKP